MVDVLLSPAFVTLLLLFYWVPFAVGAYITDVWMPRRAERSSHEVRRTKRHMGLHRPATAGA